MAGDNIYASYGSLIGSIGVRGPDWFFYDEPISISSGFIFFRAERTLISILILLN